MAIPRFLMHFHLNILVKRHVDVSFLLDIEEFGSWGHSLRKKYKKRELSIITIG
jgi:hypothetical protein